MNTKQFLADFAHVIAREKISPLELCRKSGISQGTISKLVSGKMRFIRLETAILLWPFVYGRPFPQRDKD